MDSLPTEMGSICSKLEHNIGKAIIKVVYVNQQSKELQNQEFSQAKDQVFQRKNFQKHFRTKIDLISMK